MEPPGPDRPADRRARGRWLQGPRAALALLPLLVLAPPVAAQAPAAFPPADSAAAFAPVTVGRVSVVGNVAVDSTRILRSFELATGARYSEEAVRRGIRKLFALGLFSDVWVDFVPHGQTTDLVILVHERPRISKIEITGNRKRETADLEKKLFLKPGESFSTTAARTQVDSLDRKSVV